MGKPVLKKITIGGDKYKEFVKMLEEADCRVLRIKEWKTVATDYPLKRLGVAEITRAPYRRGIYLMEQVMGYDFFFAETRIPVTDLRIRGKVVMVDDPLHWYGMEGLANASRGNVLVGGLGLGLIVHHLVKNPEVKRIDVVEMEKDVIDLIKPLLPNGKVKIHHGNIFDPKWLELEPNTIILDLWVGRPPIGEMLGAFHHFTFKRPGTPVYIWGIGGIFRGLNPAVTKDPCPIYYEVRRTLEVV